MAYLYNAYQKQGWSKEQKRIAKSIRRGEHVEEEQQSDCSILVARKVWQRGSVRADIARAALHIIANRSRQDAPRVPSSRPVTMRQAGADVLASEPTDRAGGKRLAAELERLGNPAALNIVTGDLAKFHDYLKLTAATAEHNARAIEGESEKIRYDDPPLLNERTTSILDCLDEDQIRSFREFKDFFSPLHQMRENVHGSVEFATELSAKAADAASDLREFILKFDRTVANANRSLHDQFAEGAGRKDVRCELDRFIETPEAASPKGPSQEQLRVCKLFGQSPRCSKVNVKTAAGYVLDPTTNNAMRSLINRINRKLIDGKFGCRLLMGKTETTLVSPSIYDQSKASRRPKVGSKK